MKTSFAPNTQLPKGATLLRRVVTKETGGWVRMTFDASCVRCGITWLRVKGGFGDNGEREDWVADLPVTCAHVSTDDWCHGKGKVHATFDQAVRTELARALDAAKRKRNELKEKLKQTDKGIAMLVGALAP